MSTPINYDGNCKIHARNISPVFRSKRVSEKKKAFKAVDNINLRVKDGEFVTIGGPSGCGKPTFLDMLAGLSDPTWGEICIDGPRITGPSPNRGIVLQGYALFPWCTLRQNIEYGLEIKKIPQKERHEISARFIELVGLPGFENHFPHELSGGMKQRVSLACALAYDPKVLLMDKHFAAVDAQTREILQDELLGIWEKTGKTIVFITHSIEEVVVPVRLPRPRRINDGRASINFNRISGEVWNLLQGIEISVVEESLVPTYGEAAGFGVKKRGLDSAAL